MTAAIREALIRLVAQDSWEKPYADAALAELEALEERQAALEAVAEAARAVPPKYLPLIEGLHVGAKPSSRDMRALVDALARLAAVPDGPLDTSYRERRVERRMADPEYRQAYQQATQDGQTDG